MTITVEEFEKELQSIRAENGWRIELELDKVWTFKVYDKETNRLLGCTGSTGLIGVLVALKTPFNKCPWV